jgi:hypothetical protein
MRGVASTVLLCALAACGSGHGGTSGGTGGTGGGTSGTSTGGTGGTGSCQLLFSGTFASSSYNFTITNMPGELQSIPTTNTFTLITSSQDSQYFDMTSPASGGSAESVSLSYEVSQNPAVGTPYSTSNGLLTLDNAVVEANPGTGLFGYSNSNNPPGSGTLTLTNVGAEGAGAFYPCAHGSLTANLNNNDNPNDVLTGTLNLTF